ncbi:sensor histidine kinase, partial [Streptomyces sp. URMC 123]|uniref:sensor histidine kinase n=1 Tax=Streptomyces sp. URMC 123 TaxID=3423403 RepID=UPI003F1C70AC
MSAGWFSRFALPARPHRGDVVIAAAGLAGGLILWSLDLYSNAPVRGDPGAWPLVPLVAMVCAELLRRTAQPWALLLATAALVGDVVNWSLAATVLMFTDVVYAAVLYGRPWLARQIIPISTVVTIGATISALAFYRDSGALLLGLVAGLITIAPAWTGVLVRQHRQIAETERLRAEQTALLAEMDRREAVVAERSRMARELHDMVANHLSAIAIHSTAALSIGDPKASTEALGVIRENSVQGLAEMRRLIGLLRDGGGEREPVAAPTLDALDALVERARAVGAESGLEFALRDDRGPGPLSAPVELAAYRIVQESLTNALKHAAPGPVDVALDRRADGPLIVTVTSPCADRPGPRAPGSGAGLVGMRERVALLRGELEAGPVPG